MNTYSFGPVEKISGVWGWFRGFEGEAAKFVAYGYISTKQEAVERRQADMKALVDAGHTVTETTSETDLDFQFNRSKDNLDFYSVSVEGKVIGGVLKQASWTNRGDHVFWEARANGVYVGSGATRKEAAKALVKR